MKLILDTCCIIWVISDVKSLSKKATNLLKDQNAEIFLSPISAAEIACASERRRIILDCHWKRWFRHYVELNNWQMEPMDLDIIEEAYSLPETFHSDLADRIIVATARLRKYILLTADRKILNYPHVNAVW